MKLKKYLDKIQPKVKIDKWIVKAYQEGVIMVEGYMYEDGRKDDIEGLQTSGRCMAASLGFLLGENEGIVIELPKQENFPADPHGKYIVFRKEGLIRIEEYKGEKISGNITTV